MESDEVTIKVRFSGTVSDEALDTFTELLDVHLGHFKDAEKQRWIAKDQDHIDGGWGMGRSMVTDVVRVKQETTRRTR